MSEEEKKAIEHLNSFLNIPEYVWLKENELLMVNIKIALNLIEKLQKELNSLKEIEQQHKTDNGLLRQELDMQIEHNKELKATLKQTQDSWFEDTQKLEQEKEKNKKLYEQNQIYLSNGSNVKLELHIKNNYIRKDKIKDKIEELKQEKGKYGNCLIEMYEDELVNRNIKILQELLESEE